MSTSDDRMSPAVPTSTRYLSLDFWRGIACLQVIIFHSSFYMQAGASGPPWTIVEGFIQRFWIGVPMFFVISGYCIAAAVDSARRRPASSLDFFMRRFRRIYPPYWFCLAMFIVLLGVLESERFGSALGTKGLWIDGHHTLKSPDSLTAGQWLGNVTLTESWRYQIFEGRVQALRVYFLDNIWTLCYEEQFYLLMGLVLVIAPRYMFSATAVITLLALLARHLFPKVSLGVTGFFYDGHWNVFAAGVLVYYHLNHAGPRRWWITSALLISTFLYAMREKDVLTGPYSTNNAMVMGLVFSLLLIVLHPIDRRIHEHALLKPVSWCGVMSYSLYLVHWPVTKAVSHFAFWCGLDTPCETLLVTIPLGIAASVLAGRLFYLTVERRFLNAPSSTATPQKIPVAGELSSVVQGS